MNITLDFDCYGKTGVISAFGLPARLGPARGAYVVVEGSGDKALVELVIDGEAKVSRQLQSFGHPGANFSERVDAAMIVVAEWVREATGHELLYGDMPKGR